jgi:hypothetical protein
MREELKSFEAVLAEWTAQGRGIVTIGFQVADEQDALEIAADIALLEGSELIYLSER